MSKREKSNYQVIILSLLQALLTLVCFFIFIFNGKYTGGQIGMAPFVIIKILFYQIIITILIFFLFKRILKSIYVYLFMNIIIYTLFLCESNIKCLSYIYEDNLNSFFMRTAMLSIFLPTLLISIVCKRNG